MLAAIVAMVTSTSTKDGRRRDALVTIAECGVVSVAIVAVVAVLSPHPVAADAMFVAVMSGSVLIRRFGARGFALGQLAFMTYFFALFLDARTRQLPWLCYAVVCGAACVAVVRCLLLPDRPAADLRRLLRAVEARVADLADQVQALALRHRPGPWRRTHPAPRTGRVAARRGDPPGGASAGATGGRVARVRRGSPAGLDL